MKRLCLLALLACKDDKPPPKPAPVEPMLPTEAELRAACELSSVERGGKYLVRDAGGTVTIVLPGKPTLESGMMTDGGKQAFHAQAQLREEPKMEGPGFTPGPGIEIQFGVMTMRDHDLPLEVAKMMEAAPFEIVKEAGGGDIQRNMKGELAGQPAQLFELVTPARRRVLGWYVPQPARGRMIQILCSGPEGDATRVSCDEVAASLTVVPGR